jgi:hypothetical protein
MRLDGTDTAHALFRKPFRLKVKKSRASGAFVASGKAATVALARYLASGGRSQLRSSYKKLELTVPARTPESREAL